MRLPKPRRRRSRPAKAPRDRATTGCAVLLGLLLAAATAVEFFDKLTGVTDTPTQAGDCGLLKVWGQRDGKGNVRAHASLVPGELGFVASVNSMRLSVNALPGRRLIALTRRTGIGRLDGHTAWVHAGTGRKVSMIAFAAVSAGAFGKEDGKATTCSETIAAHTDYAA